MSDRSCTVVLAAVHEELKATIQRLALSPREDAEAPGRLYTGELRGTVIVAMVTGIGAERVITALDWLIERHEPGRVIHGGFAGALDPALRPGDVPELAVVMDEHGEAWRIVGGVPQPIDRDEAGAAGPAARLLSLDRIADSMQVKAELFARHGAAAVDMETVNVAARAAEHGVPLTALRAISDPADMALPAEAINWVKPDGTPDMGAAMRYAMMHPRMMGSLMQLQKHAKKAAEALAERIEAAVRG